MKKPVIAITMGDPAGIGPEVVLKALTEKQIYKISSPIVIGDVSVLEKAKKLVKSKLNLNAVEDASKSKSRYRTIDVIDMERIKAEDFKWGQMTPLCGKAQIDYVKKAATLAIKREVDAISTAPINKEAMHKAGINYPGHTELLARLTNTRQFAMMLSGEKLRVVLVTRHVALKDVAKEISVSKIFDTIRLVYLSRRMLGFSKIRIAVCGLNPHCGEEGAFGDEEKRKILPAIQKARQMRIPVFGPFPSDTIFNKAVRGDFDVVVCMYHDQGLIPLKLLYFDKGVNVTLGLPIIRTSVDHGTAYDIAGKGIANPESLMEAVKVAVKFAKNKKSS